MIRDPSETIAAAILRWRAPLLTALALLGVVLGSAASDLRIEASFDRQLPLAHPFVDTLRHHRAEFGGADRLLIAVRARAGDIFTAEGLRALQQATDAVFFLPGIDRSSVRSLFTPNVRFVEVVEDGFVGGNVIPNGFRPTPAAIATVRANATKAGLVGRLVADDLSAGLVSASLLVRDPTTQAPIDHLAVARQLEERIRAPLAGDAIDIHITGFAKAAGDIAAGAGRVLAFLALAVALTAALVLAATRSLLLTLLPLGAAGIAVVSTLGLLTLLGFGLDPLSVLLPFLIFAIGVSHGVQVVSAFRSQAAAHDDPRAAARRALAQLLLPGALALASDAAGFLSIMVIAIGSIRELAITMTLGVTMLGLTSLLLLPLVLSLLPVPGSPVPATRADWLWRGLASFTGPRRALLTLGAALLLLGLGLVEARQVQIGDLHGGVPALRPEARYNQDAAFIAEHFAFGVDVLQVMVETEPDACVDHDLMAEIDRFQWHMANLPGVRSTLSLPQLARTINAGWYEGNPKWRVLPHDPAGLAAAINGIETSSGLLNGDCSVMPVLIFTADHKAATIQTVIDAVRAYPVEVGEDRLRLRLAGGNLAVLAATNEVVEGAELPMLLAVYAAVAGFCLLGFRSLSAMLCVVLPLGLVSVLVLALMSLLDIGLVPATLPVAALAVGIGVDYGIYVFARLQAFLADGLAFDQAWLHTLRTTGSAVLLTGSTLAIGVGSWLLADLQLQADMGLLLAAALLANMIGALVLLPALATFLIGRDA